MDYEITGNASGYAKRKRNYRGLISENDSLYVSNNHFCNDSGMCSCC